MSEPRTLTEEWKWRRREAIIRDDYTCQECGAQGGPEGDAELHVHHITPVDEGGSDDLENLKTFCASCHMKQHAKNDPGEPVMEDEHGQHHDSAGLFTPKHDTKDYLDALRELDNAAGTTEIAEAVGCPRRTAHHRLRALESEGRVTSRQVGNSLLWMIDDE